MVTKKIEKLLAKQVFTTGEAAILCQISQQTVIRCFEDGLLEGFRVPGSRFRRILRPSLLKFIRKNNLDSPMAERYPEFEFFTLSEKEIFFEKIKDSLSPRFNVFYASDSFEAGVYFAQGKIPLIDGFYHSVNLVKGILDSISKLERSEVVALLIGNDCMFKIPEAVMVLDAIPRVEDIFDIFAVKY